MRENLPETNSEQDDLIKIKFEYLKNIQIY